MTVGMFGPLTITTGALAALALGYRFYARFLAERIFGLRADESVPADTQADGVDFVKTERHVLWGHHFSSIAGAAPILGPAIAIVWGWLPAVIWIVVGVIFMGAAHDFGALVLSMRHEGQSVGALTERFIGRRAKLLFLLVIAFLIWMVGAVFAFAIARLFTGFPASILPVNLEIIVALAIGFWTYRLKRSIFWPSLIALIGLYAVIFLSASDVIPVPTETSFLRSVDFWLIGLLVYAFVASSLPVWLLLQPRDLINSHQLIVGLVAMYVGFFLSSPTFAAPAIGEWQNLPAVFPLLMVTIACGAISGFHGLVSSGTTSKQIASATDAKAIGYGSMLFEAGLALLATMAVACGVTSMGGPHVWDAMYLPITESGGFPGVGDALKAFVTGAASMLSHLGLPLQVGKTVVAVLVISFAATSLDTALRIQRLVLGEIGGLLGTERLKNRWLSGFLATASVGVLIYADKAAGAKSLWSVFGATNQVLAAITLLLCALYLRSQRRPSWPYVIPAVVVMVVTFAAMAIQVYSDMSKGNLMVGGVGATIAVLTLWVALEGAIGLKRSGAT